MPEYINREAFKQKLIDKGFFPAIVQRALEEMPSEDVVAVVRCRDCKYWTEEKDLGMFCSHWGSMLAEPQADDFCSYGERKE